MNQKKTARAAVKPVDRAIPVIRKTKNTDLAKVAITRQHTTTMRAAPLWSTSPQLQSAAAAWSAVADAIEQNAVAILDLRQKLAVLEAKQRTNRQSWRTTSKQMLGAAAVACEGSPDLVHSLGFEVYVHNAPAPQDAPVGLATRAQAASGEAAFGWQRGMARNGWVVQHAADPEDPATVSPPIPCTKTTYKVKGAPSHSLVHLRVAAIDPTSDAGMGPWCAWVVCTVR